MLPTMARPTAPADAAAGAANPTAPLSASVSFRAEPRVEDLGRVRAMVEATGFFSAAELGVALELLEDRLARGPASDYRFAFAEDGAGIAGYACFGPVPATRESWDLYWIVVEPSAQGQGLGRSLLAESERRIAREGGRRIYVDTSSRPQYAPTRSFYAACGYQVAATLEDFYAPGDGKVIYLKVLAQAGDGG
jgi:ribosomal protein S18 acetylase RimI-like enzyme